MGSSGQASRERTAVARGTGLVRPTDPGTNHCREDAAGAKVGECRTLSGRGRCPVGLRCKTRVTEDTGLEDAVFIVRRMKRNDPFSPVLTYMRGKQSLWLSLKEAAFAWRQ